MFDFFWGSFLVDFESQAEEKGEKETEKEGKRENIRGEESTHNIRIYKFVVGFVYYVGIAKRIRQQQQ